MKKKLISFILAASMLLSLPESVLADTESSIKASQSQNNTALSETTDQINNEINAQTKLQQDISNLDSQLVSLMSNIDIVTDDIKNTEAQIDAKAQELSDAQTQCDMQYADMETRIRYMYESGSGTSWFSYILEATDFSDFLNRVEYARQMNAYDRNQLDLYKQTIQETEDKKTALEQTKSELTEEQNSLTEQSDDLNTALVQKKSESDNYDSEIAALREKADALNKTISDQNAQIQNILTQKQKEAEQAEAAKALSEKASASETAKTLSDQTSSTDEAEKTSSTASKVNNTQSTSAETDSAVSAEDSSAPAAADSSADTTGQGETVSSSDNIGQQIADFACQFVGNPYVVAGESLTDGCDCAGFVKAVYAHFGVYFERNLDLYMTLGRGVSYEEAKPGDIILYSGHAALYIGNDTIVNASCPELGICIRSPATYRQIIGIRRLFDY